MLPIRFLLCFVLSILPLTFALPVVDEALNTNAPSKVLPRDSSKSSSHPSKTSKKPSPSVSQTQSKSSPIEDSLNKYIAEGLSDYIKMQGQDPSKFHALPGWRTIAAAGPHALSRSDLNAAYFETANDVLNHASAYSDTYVQYVQDMNAAYSNATNPTQQNLTALNNAANKSAGACLSKEFQETLTNATEMYQAMVMLGRAIAQHNGEGGGGAEPSKVSFTNWHDKTFLAWAQSEKNYSAAFNSCLGAQADYDREFTKLYGDNLNLFDATTEHVRPLIIPGGNEEGAVQGITMPVGDDKDAPVYDIPLLKGTLQAWITSGKKDSASQPSYVWKSNSSASSDDHFTLRIQHIALMHVDPGMWFDDHRSARAILHADPSDKFTAATKPAFDKYYGSKDKPGDAAVTNDLALVAYMPEWAYDAVDVEAAEELGKGNGTEGWKVKVDGKSVKYEDTSGSAVVLGFVQANFWDDVDDNEKK